MAKKSFDLNSPEGRKRALQDIVKAYGNGEATASDARNALQLLMKLEGDISDVRNEAIKADPYSVMKVFLRAEGLSEVEALRKHMSDNEIAEGIAKVLDATKVGVEFSDGNVGKYIKTFKEEREERNKSSNKETHRANEAEGLVAETDVQDGEAKEGADDPEPEQAEKQTA